MISLLNFTFLTKGKREKNKTKYVLASRLCRLLYIEFQSFTTKLKDEHVVE